VRRFSAAFVFLRPLEKTKAVEKRRTPKGRPSREAELPNHYLVHQLPPLA